MHYDLVIITKLNINEAYFKKLNYLIIKEATINDDKSINIEDRKITYDYLIIDKLYDNLQTLKEDKKIITNQVFETSIANIFAIGEINNSKTPLNKQIKTIIGYIQNQF